ncbi:MAG: ABC transporter permease subunit [Pseudomonadota bacterium]
MADQATAAGRGASSSGSALSFLFDPKIRGIFFQVVLLLSLVFFFWWIVDNTATNLAEQDKRTGFGFLSEKANFAILTTPGTWLFEYQSGESTYWDVFLIGIVNTLSVAVLGIIAATIIGFVLGVFRLSSNIVLRGFATVYVELLRNTPLLLQFFVWYKVLGEFLPDRRGEPWDILGVFTLDKSGLRGPFPYPQDGFELVLIAFALSVIGAILLGRWAKWRQDATGKPFPSFWVGAGMIVLIPITLFYALGAPLEWEEPVRGRFGFRDGAGMVMKPEMFAVWLALTLYTAAFIAEIVRAGILAINKGQTEAAHALGLRAQPTLNLIIIPQAMRVIIPPLTSQYLNLTKNSSLAVAIGYTDLYSLLGTVNQKVGQEVEIILMVMAVYLTFSITISLVMNWYNKRIALVER